MKYEIRNWLEGDLPLCSNPEAQTSRQTRKYLCTLFVPMLTSAVSKQVGSRLSSPELVFALWCAISEKLTWRLFSPRSSSR